MSQRDPCIDAYIEKSADFARPILRRLREVVHEARPEVLESEAKDGAMGQLGRITSLKDLPPKRVLAGYVKKAVALEDAGVKPAWTKARAAKATSKDVHVPEELGAALALKKNRKAKVVFDGFPPSHRREYAEWIAEAKRPGTRARRVAQAVEWIAEGKQRNRKYEGKSK